MSASVYTDSTKMDQIFPNKLKFHAHIYFYCKIYTFCCCYGNSFFKTIFSLLHELSKMEVPKITKKWDWTKCFLHNSPLVIKSQI